MIKLSNQDHLITSLKKKMPFKAKRKKYIQKNWSVYCKKPNGIMFSWRHSLASVYQIDIVSLLLAYLVSIIIVFSKVLFSAFNCRA